MADNASIDKRELEGSDDSTAGAETRAPQQKRKGGRRRIYATSEERKQRNRQAQAAFRDRRTEYIGQLEENVRVAETALYNLQTTHRSAADECLMLRYKNSLLERVLLEKGIDVNAELQKINVGYALAAQAPMPNAALKIKPELPQLRSTSTSHASPAIPSAVSFNSPMVAPPSGFPGSPIYMELGKEQRTGDTKGITTTAEESSQRHLIQLEREYSAEAPMVDDGVPFESFGPGPYPGALSITCLQQQTPNQQQLPTLQNQDTVGNYPILPLDSYDPMLDIDPFGLSTSMQFPTPFFLDASGMNESRLILRPI